MRAVIDTSVWVSALLAPAGFSAGVIGLLRGFRFEPVFCDDTLLELKDAMTEPHTVLRHGLRLAPLNRLITLIISQGLEVEPGSRPLVARDPNDDIFIALAVAARAEYLVTRDDDLKGDPRVRDYLAAEGVTVATVREFVAALSSESP